MGGTAGNDIIVSSIGDDTLYGDAGNDRLEGGDGVDMILGGAGDDIITDLGGDDVIQGGDGNDAIQGGNGINLIIGGFGQDFINSGEDSSEIFGGPGNDFLYGSRVNEQDMGNEGDDWLEHGNADGSPGDNFDPFGRDQVIGNDVYIGDTVVDIMNAEGGDDIMVGNGGQQDHYLGASGFDWADVQGQSHRRDRLLRPVVRSRSHRAGRKPVDPGPLSSAWKASRARNSAITWSARITSRRSSPPPASPAASSPISA